MAESTSWQYEANPAFWLTTQAKHSGSGFPTLGPASKSYYFLTHIINPSLNKLVVARRINFDLVLFCVFNWWPISSHLDRLAWSKTHIYSAPSNTSSSLSESIYTNPSTKSSNMTTQRNKQSLEPNLISSLSHELFCHRGPYSWNS